MVGLATEEPKWLNNEIIVFYLTHKFFDVQIKGILDMDYFEDKSNPLQFFDENKELQWDFPTNPYEFSSAEYKAYNQIIHDFRRNEKEIIEKLEDCIGVEHYSYEWFNIEMESLTW